MLEEVDEPVHYGSQQCLNQLDGSCHRRRTQKSLVWFSLLLPSITFNGFNTDFFEIIMYCEGFLNKFRIYNTS